MMDRDDYKGLAYMFEDLAEKQQHRMKRLVECGEHRGIDTLVHSSAIYTEIQEAFEAAAKELEDERSVDKKNMANKWSV